MAVCELSATFVEVTQAPTQPSAYAAITRPLVSTVMSLESSRLRVSPEHAMPARQIAPRCTGSFGVASVVAHVLPRLYVIATYRCHSPPSYTPSWLASPKSGAWRLPGVVVPRKANAARSPSPAMTYGNTAFWIPKTAP